MFINAFDRKKPSRQGLIEHAEYVYIFFNIEIRCTFIFVVISLRNDFLGSMRGATTQPMVTISNVWDYFPSL